MYKGIPTHQGVDVWPVTTQIPVVVKVTNTADVKIAAAAIDRIRPKLQHFFERCRREHFASGLDVMSRHWEVPEGRLDYNVVHNREIVLLTVSGELLDELTEKKYVVAIRADPGVDWYMTVVYGVTSPAEPEPPTGITTVKKVDQQGARETYYNFIDIPSWYKFHGSVDVAFSMWVGMPDNMYVETVSPVAVGSYGASILVTIFWAPGVCGEVIGGPSVYFPYNAASIEPAAHWAYLEMSDEDRVLADITSYFYQGSVVTDPEVVLGWANSAAEAETWVHARASEIYSSFPQYDIKYDDFTGECSGTFAHVASEPTFEEIHDTIDVATYAPMHPNVRVEMVVIELDQSDPDRADPGDDLTIKGTVVDHENCREIFESYGIPIYDESFRIGHTQESRYAWDIDWEELRIDFVGILKPRYDGSAPFQPVLATKDYGLWEQFYEDIVWPT